MAPSRRMRKQGMPDPLENFLNPENLAKEGVNRGKKRTAAGNFKDKSANEALSGRSKKAKHSTTPSKNPRNGGHKSNPPARKPIAEEAGTEELDELMKDAGSESDLSGEEEIDLDNQQNTFMDSDSSVVDSDDERVENMFSEDDDESDAEEKLTAANIEGLSRRLDSQKAAEEAEAQAELEDAAMQTNIEGDVGQLIQDDMSDTDGVRTTLKLAPDLQLLRTRITDNIRVLEDMAKLAEPGRSRSEYTAQLEKDIVAYYGYSPFLANKLLSLFSPREAFEFFEANETPRPIVLRTNTLKTHRRELAQTLIGRGVTLEPVGKWSKVGLQVFESQVPLGATPEYLAGHYILQAASSFLPVMALAPQENERVLDMAAAPGGKTTHMAALMRNTGCIFANDSNKARAKGLIGNIHRLGARNTIVCNHDARQFPKVMGGFDRVLLDAPCSGTGVIAKDPSVKTNKTERDFLALPHLQKQLLLAAIDSVDHGSKTGGYIVYSTCSVTVEENEMVVQYALRKRPNVRLVETGLPFGVEGFVNFMGKSFDAKLKLTRRYYPHTYNVDGFFVAKFQKTGPSPKNVSKENGSANAGDEVSNGIEDAIDRTLIGDEEEPFGGWDEEEDKVYMEKAERKRMRKKGLNLKANKALAKRSM